MPETRYTRTYNAEGELVEEIPYTVSDEALAIEACDADANTYHRQALEALAKWSSLTAAQKDKVLKFLLEYYLSSARRLGYFLV